MTVKEYQSLFRLRFKPEVEFAMLFLEDRGGRMGVEFGYSDAIKKASDMLCLEIELEEGYGFGV